MHSPVVASFPGSPRTGSDGKLGGAWERGYTCGVLRKLPPPQRETGLQPCIQGESGTPYRERKSSLINGEGCGL